MSIRLFRKSHSFQVTGSRIFEVQKTVAKLAMWNQEVLQGPVWDREIVDSGIERAL
jgi:hypothetical protein